MSQSTFSLSPACKCNGSTSSGLLSCSSGKCLLFLIIHFLFLSLLPVSCEHPGLALCDTFLFSNDCHLFVLLLKIHIDTDIYLQMCFTVQGLFTFLPLFFSLHLVLLWCNIFSDFSEDAPWGLLFSLWFPVFTVSLGHSLFIFMYLSCCGLSSKASPGLPQISLLQNEAIRC